MCLHPVQLFVGGASHDESVLHGQGLLQQKTTTVLLSAGDLPAVAVRAYGDHMIMSASDVVMPVDSIGLIGKAQPFHDIRNQFPDPVLTQILRT